MEGVEVPWDYREAQEGEKLSADLIGKLVRLVVSIKTGDKVELKERENAEQKLVDMSEFMNYIEGKI